MPFVFQNRIVRGTPVIFSSKHESMIKEVSAIEQTLADADLENELEIVFSTHY